jgi:hypothetical protein
MKLPFYLDIDIEWGHVRFGPMVFSWFNSDTRYKEWGSLDLLWDFKHSFLFAFNEKNNRPQFISRAIDPLLTATLKGSKNL